MRRRALGIIAIWLFVPGAPVLAHPLDPALLELHERADGTVAVRFQTPTPTLLQAILPVRCRALAAPLIATAARSTLQRWEVACGTGTLAGERIGIAGLRARQTDAVLRVELRDGRLIETVLRPDEPSVVVAAPNAPGTIAHEYLARGLRGTFSAAEQLVFVFAIVLFSRDVRRLVLTLTAFMLGTSIATVLSALHLVPTSASATALLIAAGIVGVAARLAGTPSSSPARSQPFFVIVAFVFGLVNGVNLGAAMTSTAVQPTDIPAALMAYNAGIETGLVLFVAAVLAIIALVRALPVRWPARTRLVPAYAIGSIAALWVLERIFG